MPKKIINDKQFSLFDEAGNPTQFQDDQKRKHLESSLRMWGATIRTKHNKEDWEGAAKHYDSYIKTHNELYPDNPITLSDMNNL